jgi:hypothetical protein
MRVTISITHEGQRFVGEVELQPAGSGRLPSGSQYREIDEARAVARKPSEAVDLVYRNGFFKESRALSDVLNELRHAGYSFSRQSILMALQAARFLSRTGTRGYYRFIQKFPPAAEAVARRVR